MKIICFAYSAKYNKNCFAGKELDTNTWIRPVLNELGDGIDNLSTGLSEKPKLLDIYNVPLIEKVELNHQKENYLFEIGKWKKVGTLNKLNITNYLDKDKDILWVNGFHSSLGLNNRFPIDYINKFNYSLMLIEVKELVIYKKRNIYNSPRLYGEFQYKGEKHILNITCEIEDADMKRLNEKIKYIYKPFNNKILCISTGQPYGDGNVYKLIASIITI